MKQKPGYAVRLVSVNDNKPLALLLYYITINGREINRAIEPMRRFIIQAEIIKIFAAGYRLDKPARILDNSLRAATKLRRRAGRIAPFKR